jgi:2-polyprenyl-3-methyl-5-hydroxy-6-metoxy-1,4-benzoquinol methylase
MVPAKSPVIAYLKEALISPEYRDLNAQLHATNMAYGVGGEKHVPNVLKMCGVLKTKDVLDYGCGKGRLAKALPFHIQEYDPAIPGKDESPKPADIVVCTDVLEHIEPDKLLYVLHDLRRVVRVAGFFLVHTGPAQKTLPDGRNTHLLQHPKAWWEKRLRKFFTVAKVEQQGPELLFIVGPKRKA